MGKNESVDEGQAKWRDEPGSGPRAECCTPLVWIYGKPFLETNQQSGAVAF